MRSVCNWVVLAFQRYIIQLNNISDEISVFLQQTKRDFLHHITTNKLQSLTILTCRVQFKKVKLFVYSHPPAIYLQSSHCYCIVPTRIMPCQKKRSTCHELKVSQKEVPHWLDDLKLLLFTRSFRVFCFGDPLAINTTIIIFFLFFVIYTYVYFSLFLNQCVCFTKKQAALVAEWVPLPEI